MIKLLTKLFGSPEGIIGNEGSTTHLYRWIILDNERVKLYLHHFVGDDSSHGLDNYREPFVSIGLTESHDCRAAEDLHVYTGQDTWMMLIARSHGKGQA